MKNMLRIVLGQIALSAAYILVWLIMDFAGAFDKAGIFYIEGTALLCTYGILLVINNEQDMEKKAFKIWLAGSALSALVSFLIICQYYDMFTAFVIAAGVYGISAEASLGYRITRNLQLYKIPERIFYLVMLFLVPFIYNRIIGYFSLDTIVLKLLPIFILIALFYWGLKKRKIL